MPEHAKKVSLREIQVRIFKNQIFFHIRQFIKYYLYLKLNLSILEIEKDASTYARSCSN